MEVIGPNLNLGLECEPVLRSLPDWFGIESAIVQYVRDIDVLPTFRALIDGHTVGFLTVKRHFTESAEIHVMGVSLECHRQGIGRSLVESAEEWLRIDGCQCLQVKTISESHTSKHYASTRDFYRSIGFTPLEEFPTLWHEANPCLLMIKPL